MRSPLVLETERVLNISTDFQSSPLSAPASHLFSQSEGLQTQVVEDSLKEQTTHAMPTKKKGTFDISSSPDSATPNNKRPLGSKRNVVDGNGDPVTSSLPAKTPKHTEKIIKQPVKQPANELVVLSDDDDDDEDSDTDDQEESDPYIPSQPKKVATLGEKLSTKTKRANVFDSLKAATKSAPVQTIKKDAAKKSTGLTTGKSIGSGKDKVPSKQTTNEGRNKKSFNRVMKNTANDDRSDLSSYEDGGQDTANRKNRMQTSSKVVQHKAGFRPSNIKSKKHATKAAQSAAQHAVIDNADNEREAGKGHETPVTRNESTEHMQSSPPVKVMKEAISRPTMPLVSDRQSKGATIVQFGKDGPREHDQLPAKRVREHEPTLHSEPVKKKAKSTALTAEHSAVRPQKSAIPKAVKDHKGRNSVHHDQSNIAAEDEDALAGFNIASTQRTQKPSTQAHSSAFSDTVASAPAKTQTLRSPSREADLAQAAPKTDLVAPGSTSSQLVMPPPKPAAKSTNGHVGDEVLHGSSMMKEHHHKQTRKIKTNTARLTGRTGGNESDLPSKNQEERMALKPGLQDGSPPGHGGADDSGYISAGKIKPTTASQKPQPVQKRHKLLPATVVSERGSPILAGQSLVMDRATIAEPLRRGLKDGAEAQSIETNGNTTGIAAAMLPSEIEKISTTSHLSKPQRQVTTHVQSTLPLKPWTDAAEKPSPWTSTRSFEEILDWRSELQVHQRGLFDQLVSDAEVLVTHLIRREEVIKDLVDDYRDRGQNLINHLEIMNAKEFQQQPVEKEI